MNTRLGTGPQRRNRRRRNGALRPKEVQENVEEFSRLNGQPSLARNHTPALR